MSKELLSEGVLNFSLNLVKNHRSACRRGGVPSEQHAQRAHGHHMMYCECNAYEKKISPRTAYGARPGLARARGCMICWLSQVNAIALEELQDALQAATSKPRRREGTKVRFIQTGLRRPESTLRLCAICAPIDPDGSVDSNAAANRTATPASAGLIEKRVRCMCLFSEIWTLRCWCQ